MEPLAGRVALVTGAGRGIGRALAEHAAQEGMLVVLTDGDLAALEETERLLKGEGATVLAVGLDLARPTAAERLVQEALDEYGALHLLAVAPPLPAEPTGWESPPSAWQAALEASVVSTASLLRATLSPWQQQGEGQLLLVLSAPALLPTCPQPLAHVTQHALLALAEQVSASLATAEANIGVSVLLSQLENETTTPSATLAEEATAALAALRQRQRLVTTRPELLAQLRQHAVRRWG
jgi:NAD(P)-dependent dehydrogenase (short-subunit alcohol dehydrogenase family)